MHHEVSHSASQLRFQHHFINTDLPIDRGYIGDYGQSALGDIDNDGRPEFIFGRKGSSHFGIQSVIYWFDHQSDDHWEKHILGYDSWSDVGACLLDVDGDGWLDLVCSGVWYRNSGNPRETGFTRQVFDIDGAGAHDVVAADIDGDGKQEIVILGDGSGGTTNGIFWYKIADDPTRPWAKHYIGPAIHGAIAPSAIADIDGDGDVDIVCADTWYENVNGDGSVWRAHQNIPFGKPGPFGLCVRCVIEDIDNDGKQELIMCDADVPGSRAAVIKNADGHGGKWENSYLPQSFEYGSLHSLAVADFTGNGRLDILVNEQEELLPEGRANSRWIIWENQGNGMFEERIILDTLLGGHELMVGDIDGDGRIDICSKIWGPMPWNACGGAFHADFLKNVSDYPTKA